MELSQKIHNILTTQNLPRPAWDDYFCSTALLISSRSPCERLHVGCVIVSNATDPNRILATGYNGFLPNASHTSRIRDNHEQSTVHAEQNALMDAAKRGISVKDSKIYVTHFPCIICTRLLIAGGIKKVHYLFDYKNDPIAEELFKETNTEVIKLTL
jgi:dCMP deaminase